MLGTILCKILPESTRCPGLLTKLMYNRYGYPHVAVPPPSAPCRPKSRVSLFRPGVLLHLGGGPVSCMCPIFIFMLQWKGKRRPWPASSWHHGVFVSCGGAGAAFYILLLVQAGSPRRPRAPVVCVPPWSSRLRTARPCRTVGILATLRRWVDGEGRPTHGQCGL